MSDFLKFKTKRINRIEYLSLGILLLLIMAIMLFVPRIMAITLPNAEQFNQQLPNIVKLLEASWFLLTFSIAAFYRILLGIKRLHDLNWSGWAVLLLLIPIFGIGWSIYLLCAPGTKGENRFGEQPQPTALSHKITPFVCLFALFILTVGIGILSNHFTGA